MIAGICLLSLRCEKKLTYCPKEGVQYANSSFHCWYAPTFDSIPLGSSITLEAAVPRSFIDELSNTMVTNTSQIIHGPLGVGMIFPEFKPAVDSFELTPIIGKVIKDTVNFSAGILKGFRTIEWDGSGTDSFKMKVSIKALVKGVYSFSLKQQSYKDADCALYKYFLNPGNSDKHLNYWSMYVGPISTEVDFYSYCIKVY